MDKAEKKIWLKSNARVNLFFFGVQVCDAYRKYTDYAANRVNAFEERSVSGSVTP